LLLKRLYFIRFLGKALTKVANKKPELLKVVFEFIKVVYVLKKVAFLLIKVVYALKKVAFVLTKVADRLL
jgi:hypothetical protein